MLSVTSRWCAAVFLMASPLLAQAEERGIYLTQYTLENTKTLNYLIDRSKATGINTFVVDISQINNKYDKNIALLKENNIKYVARVVVFPYGGTDETVHSMAQREARYSLVQHAINLGASAIQLDYIRYDTHRGIDKRYTSDIHEVVKWFKTRVAAQNVPLQIDVFGETCFGPSQHIGQDLTVLADTVDAVNPMVYPSHYNPYPEHSAHPYDTIYDSLTALDDQFDGPPPFKVHAFIETSNYHYNLSAPAAQKYIKAQIKATRDAKVEGWYAWSAHNKYDNLFAVLEANQKAYAENDTSKEEYNLRSK